MSTDQYTFQDPTKMYADIQPSAQQQDGPGLDAALDDTADRGERTYRGSNRLEGRKALVTGADSGIGAAVAIAYAREGADVALSYLPRRRRTRRRSSPSSRRRAGRPSPSPATSPRRSSAASSSRRRSRASAASTSS
ncbi:putative oxidoreductase YghA [Clavibacter michiganensis subsp. michiganensis]|nr:putative oxidoreductase YghA [Clavibacter michiganensis subsp. michiganensis]